MKCKYVAKHHKKGLAKRMARALRADGFRSRVRKVKGGYETLSCGRSRR